MKENNYALVTASQEFWGSQLAKVLKLTLCENSGSINQELVFDNSNNRAIKAIVDISKDNPEEDFFINTYSDDVFENFQQAYKCRNGNLELITEGYVLFFDYRPKDDLPMLPPKIIQSFEKEATYNFKQIKKLENKRSRRTDKMISDDSIEHKSKPGKISHILEYRVENICLTAQKLGKSLVVVDIKFLDDIQTLIERKKQESSLADPFA